MAEEIVNRVANSGLITLDLEEYHPAGERVVYDLAQNLWQGIALKEKDFRDFIKTNDWSAYAGKHVAIHCSADAIIPQWAYVLLASVIGPHAEKVIFGSLEDLETALYRDVVAGIDAADYSDARVIIKGCSKHKVPESAYIELTAKLQPVVKSLMYGEPCSTVPIYKKAKG